MPKPLVVILLLLAGLLAGFWLGGAEMVRGIRLMWPDLYEEMLRRSEDDA